MLTVGYQYVMVRVVQGRGESTCHHVLVKLQRFFVCGVGTHALVNDLAILVEAAVRGDCVFGLGRPQEGQCVCEFTIEGTREEDSAFC